MGFVTLDNGEVVHTSTYIISRGPEPFDPYYTSPELLQEIKNYKNHKITCAKNRAKRKRKK